MAGDVTLSNGIPVNTTLDIDGELQAGATVDLTNDAVAGSLLIDGGGSGSIVFGQVVSGMVQLADGSTKSWSGDATFTDVTSAGTIKTINGADLKGDCSVSVSMAGLIEIDGSIVKGAELLLGGLSNAISGTVRCDDLAGLITLDGQLPTSGFIDILGGVIGTGQITSQHVLQGDIRIGKGTSINTQIIIPGLSSSSRITINYVQGDFDADGDMTIGSPVPASVTFDGSIVILTDGVNGGDLGANALPLIQGCHATSDDLQFVVCGSELCRNPPCVMIEQSGCANQVTDPSPDTCD